MPGPTVDELVARLEAERASTARLVTALSDDLDGVMASMDLANNDDEHDPDGATNGYERAKATSLLAHARTKLDELEAAAERARAGTYGRCQSCGDAINPERLEALPATAVCTACAR
jgi:DnaK suppressor protein